MSDDGLEVKTDFNFGKGNEFLLGIKKIIHLQDWSKIDRFFVRSQENNSYAWTNFTVRSKPGFKISFYGNESVRSVQIHLSGNIIFYFKLEFKSKAVDSDRVENGFVNNRNKFLYNKYNAVHLQFDEVINIQPDMYKKFIMKNIDFFT